MLRVAIADGTPATLFEGGVYAWRILRVSNQILLCDEQGLLILNLASGARRRIEACGTNFRPIMSDNEETLLCPGGRSWGYVDLRAGSATLLADLEGSVLRSPESQRWAVFGSGFIKNAMSYKPARIVDLRTGQVVARSDKTDIIGVAPDGSGVLLSNDYLGRKIWLHDSDGASRIIHQADREAFASFSPDGQFILLSNTLYDAEPVPGPISVLDRNGKVMHTMPRFGIAPLWLKP